MRLAIMQPYFFPYVGYFQLMAAAERFVVYDDVAFIKNGWINRNRLLTTTGPEYFTIPLAGASSFRAIYETKCAPPKAWRDKMLRTLSQAYARAPERDAGLGIVERVLAHADTESVRDLAVDSLREICDYASIDVDWRDSSRAYENADLSSVARVLDICKRETASIYVNAPGGRGLYDAEIFRRHGIELRFLTPDLEPYEQPRAPTFVPGLSVVDMVMRLPRSEVRRRLHAGSLVT